jgi:hypothetical protein
LVGLDIGDSESVGDLARGAETLWSYRELSAPPHVFVTMPGETDYLTTFSVRTKL